MFCWTEPRPAPGSPAEKVSPVVPREVRLPRTTGTGVAAAVALALLASVAITTSANATAGAAAPPVNPSSALALADPHIVAHFDVAAGRTPENIALEPDGSADLTFAVARQVARVDPDGATRVLATLPAPDNPATPVIGIPVTAGIVRTHDGTLYVNYSTGTADLTGVWRIDPDGTASRFAALPPTGFANGLALDPEDGALYAADSALGRVWRISPEDGAVSVWATGTELEATGFIGANGIKVHRGAVWVSNTDRGTILRIPFEEDGSAGPVRTHASGLAGIDDFAFTGHGETAIATLHPSSEVALVRPDGTHEVELTAEDGLSNPTAVAVRGREVYISSAAFTTMSDPNLLLARIIRKDH
jgi:sugar lactone lactonase YvrE